MATIEYNLGEEMVLAPPSLPPLSEHVVKRRQTREASISQRATEILKLLDSNREEGNKEGNEDKEEEEEVHKLPQKPRKQAVRLLDFGSAITRSHIGVKPKAPSLPLERTSQQATAG